MSRADRLLQVVQLLRRYRRPVRGAVMADELSVSLRTLYRDVADLQASGVPIRGEAGVGYVLGAGYDVPPLMFTTDELEAVMLGLSWVERRGDMLLSRAAKDAVAKIGSVLPSELKANFYDAPLMTPPGYAIVPDTVDVGLIRKAMRSQSKVEISYMDEKAQATRRVIWPIAISYFDAQRIIVAWCELRIGFRHFRTDRIAGMTLMVEKYREPRLKLLTRWRKEQTALHGSAD
jgi:predicted DNA-binding transcriptional regulator YafY